MNLLFDLASMWNEVLGNIITVKHQIRLKPDRRPAFQNPYRDGLQTKENEGQQIDWTLEEDVI